MVTRDTPGYARHQKIVFSYKHLANIHARKFFIPSQCSPPVFIEFKLNLDKSLKLLMIYVSYFNTIKIHVCTCTIDKHHAFIITSSSLTKFATFFAASVT